MGCYDDHSVGFHLLVSRIVVYIFTFKVLASKYDNNHHLQNISKSSTLYEHEHIVVCMDMYKCKQTKNLCVCVKREEEDI